MSSRRTLQKGFDLPHLEDVKMTSQKLFISEIICPRVSDIENLCFPTAHSNKHFNVYIVLLLLLNF